MYSEIRTIRHIMLTSFFLDSRCTPCFGVFCMSFGTDQAFQRQVIPSNLPEISHHKLCSLENLTS